jgi:hypothetical protein
MEKYEPMEIKVIKFDMEDVITTSPTGGDVELPEEPIGG